jgi:hypothetical protein
MGSGKARTIHLRFPAAEVKNSHDLEFPLMPETSDLLEIYLVDWRQLLVSGPCAHLFPGKLTEQHKGKGTLSS